MNAPAPIANRKPSAKPSLSYRYVPLLILVASASYGLAFATRSGGPAIFLAMICILLLSRLPTARQAFYIGLLCGLAIFIPQLWFFFGIFHGAALGLWLIAAMPIGMTVVLIQQSRRRFGATSAMLLTPILWTGVEFFRCELYYFRFTWLIPGQAAAFLPGVRMMWVGVYGLGFLYALGAALFIGRQVVERIFGAAILLTLAVLMYMPKMGELIIEHPPLFVAGVQLEKPTEVQVASALEHLATAHPEAQILVLSEYTFPADVPQMVRDVIRKHHRYLIAGGVEQLPNDQFRDTAYVIGPDGNDLFSQCKSVPVQLMGDGLPAQTRRVWESPWGKIGIAVCYDISYANVMDDFVSAGAQGLIIPTMDLKSWGRYEREMLHGRMAPIRAAEYGIPVFSVWSSGISQLVDSRGNVVATAGYPGQGEMIAGQFDLLSPGRVPPDRYFAYGTTLISGALLAYFSVTGLIERRKSRRRATVVD